MANALARPRPQLSAATTLTINDYLQSIDNNWPIISDESKLVSDDNMWFTWNYKLNEQVEAFITTTYNASGNSILPTLEFYTPNVATYKASLTQIARIGQLISKSNNELKGTDTKYYLKGITFIYSWFGAYKGGFKLNGKPVILYKIVITKE